MKTTTLLPRLLLIISIIAFFLAIPTAGHAQGLPLSVEVDYADGAGANGHPLAILWLTAAEGYHTYAHGETEGLPTTVTVRDAQGRPADVSVLYPAGHVTTDSFDPNKRIRAYSGRFPIFIRFDALPQQPGAQRYLAEVSMLLCSDKNCVPVQQEISLTFPVPLPALPSGALAAYREALDGPAPSSPSSAPSAAPSPQATLAPALAATPQALPAEWHFTPRFPQDSLEPTALGTALVLGLLAGLLLNVMPCVLPVLTMKVSALLTASGHADERKRLAHFRQHNILFAAGILTWFLVLAVCVGGLGLAWGGLFQHTGVVYGLLILVFLLALSLFDVFTLPVLDFKVGASANPRAQAYLTGLVATLLATPCSGPLLGGVLGWVALQPLPVVVAVFTATGLGMALPYLVLAAWPGAARILPKPGAWTGIMERLVGFFLMGTALYLLSILPESRRLAALAALLACALAAWMWGRWGGLRASLRQKALVGALALLVAGGSVWWSVLPAPEPAPWEPFRPETFHALLKKEPLLVDFTADWCPSCKFLEQTVLTPKRLRSLQERYGLRFIKVDLTRPDPQAQALLRALGSVSIPVTAIFPRGLLSNSPLVLRDLYTSGQLDKALSTLSPRK